MSQDVRAASEVNSASPFLPDSEPFFRLFHINDSTDDQVLFQAACRTGHVRFNWHVTDSAEKGISYMKALIDQSKQVPVCWPDLVLLDILMPLVSGFEVLKFIRATPEVKHLPVVVWSGYGLPGNRERCLEMGANLFLIKPTEFSDVVKFAKQIYEMVKQMKSAGPDASPL
jgi:CheY-like chemotaxis protein